MSASGTTASTTSASMTAGRFGPRLASASTRLSSNDSTPKCRPPSADAALRSTSTVPRCQRKALKGWMNIQPHFQFGQTNRATLKVLSSVVRNLNLLQLVLCWSFYQNMLVIKLITSLPLSISGSICTVLVHSSVSHFASVPSLFIVHQKLSLVHS